MSLTTSTGRSLAPDLARGFMLLAIALAHAPVFVSGPASGVIDDVAAFLDHLLAHNQARPMFVFLFGYALGQLAHRHQGDWASLKRLLRRRGRWLIVIGFLHGVLLVPLDIVAVYGLTLLVLVPLVRARDSVLCWTAALMLVPAALMVSAPVMLAYAGAVPLTGAGIMPADLGSHLLSGLQLWPFKTALGTIDVVPGMALGIWAARRRILDEPGRHRTLLGRATVICLGAAIIGRLPGALLLAGMWTPPVPWAVVLAHTLFGYAGGIGLAALIGLVATRVESGALTTALAALGQRSLTFYLFQSVAFLVLFYPFTLDLADELGFASASGIGVAIWAVSVALAEWMRRAGRRGPAEVMLRRLTYRRSPAP
ncbi:DUF418 domain-containing protein [Nonomuraea sp. SYSU D8015]|uniref:DUF418 domain-containing protein n=1 Tax=Nonomuraea sp. SYSU D8015 TaxID=2593644 RepID=UPI0016613465|nr:DUF418 domain-containing protein [Nonomuraea sp. SYSU D8015]